MDSNPVPKTMLSSLSSQLTAIERRDWELWVLLLGTGIVISLGLLIIVFPSSFYSNGALHIDVTISKELFFGFISLLVLFNLYVISRKFEFRRTRQQLVSSTIQNEIIRLQSFNDPLTEVYNRRSLDEMAARYVSRAGRLKTDLTFLLIDVDRFKEVNSKFGHLTGDVVLAEMAAILRSCVRGCDSVVRYGGDEFLILLEEANIINSEIIVQRITKALTGWNQRGQLQDFEVTMSIGLSQWQEGKSLDEMLAEADRHMYAQKKIVQDQARGRH